ncbi:MAG: ATP-binding protein [Candidatus Hydrothermarchaeales archaeon]
MSRFLRLMQQYPKAIMRYCEALQWDYDKFKVSISDEGISHPDLYLEDPNLGIIDKLSQFLEPTNQSSVFIIWDDVGMGKSSIRDFVSKSLDEIGNYHVVLITDPRITSFQLLREIALQIEAEAKWRDRAKVKRALSERLAEIVKKGVNLVIWVDEAEKVTKDIISELRALSDVKAESGLKVCKIVLSGTPRLMQKIDEYIEHDPEDALAFDDRASLNTFRLNKWTSRDIFNYWKLVSQFCGEMNPFTVDAADTVHRISEGKPRTISQITKLVINLKSMKHTVDDSALEISSEDILASLKGHLEE